MFFLVLRRFYKKSFSSGKKKEQKGKLLGPSHLLVGGVFHMNAWGQKVWYVPQNPRENKSRPIRRSAWRSSACGLSCYWEGWSETKLCREIFSEHLGLSESDRQIVARVQTTPWLDEGSIDPHHWKLLSAWRKLTRSQSGTQNAGFGKGVFCRHRSHIQEDKNTPQNMDPGWASSAFGTLRATAERDNIFSVKRSRNKDPSRGSWTELFQELTSISCQKPFALVQKRVALIRSCISTYHRYFVKLKKWSGLFRSLWISLLALSVQRTSLTYLRKNPTGPPDPQSPKTPQQQKKTPKTLKSSRIPKSKRYFPQSKRYFPKSKRYFPKRKRWVCLGHFGRI